MKNVPTLTVCLFLLLAVGGCGGKASGGGWIPSANEVPDDKATFGVINISTRLSYIMK